MVLRWDVNQEDIASALKDAGAEYTYIDRQDFATVLKRLEISSQFGVDHQYIDDQDISEFINQQEGGLGGSIPAPTLDLDLTIPTTASLLTTVRASAAWADNVDGVWTQFNANIPRITNKGLLVEEGRTNSIRNNSMQGAVVGSPGTLPTNWVTSALSPLTFSIVGKGIDNGVDYIDFRLSGTAVAAMYPALFFDAGTVIAAAAGQIWDRSAFMSLQAGSFNNAAAYLFCYENDGTGVLLRSISGSAITSLPATLTRVSRNWTLGAGTLFLRPGIYVAVQGAGPVDITLRIGWPQLELGAFRTSPIRTTNVAVARAADVIRSTAVVPAYPLTLFAETMIPVSAGAASLTSFEVDDAGGNNADRSEFLLTSSSGTAALFSRTAAGAQGSAQPANTFTVGSYFKTAAAFAANDFAISLNGGTVAIDTSGAVAAPLVRFSLGVRDMGDALLNGYLRRVRYWNTRRPNNELRVMTS